MFLKHILYWIVKNAFLIIFTLYNRLEVRGTANIQANVPIILASNHASNADPPLIGGAYPGRLRYIAKESLFRVPVLGFFIRALGAIPVSREDSQRAGAVMKLMLDRLKDGESILIFPEGTRSGDGRLKPLEGGAALLSVKSGVPILPVYISGSHRFCPKGSLLPRPVKLTITFAAPVFPDAGAMSDKEKRMKLMRELEESLVRMAGEVDQHD
ncbi:MAG: 1-acyl-sn-glycerol-3-phosphate acyltransferase [Synergistaceae bacterium]|jgi:1-acyl-sn-glycerol-3-phosphate acyltransferase|nr:1-acyl-sn-glycerol-3-phosphate acyltransferase [Synergistaceae bacterium]